MNKTAPAKIAITEPQVQNSRQSHEPAQLLPDSTKFIDSRAQAVAQMRLQHIADNSPQTRQLQAFNHMARTSPQATQLKALSTSINAPAPQFATNTDRGGLSSKHAADLSLPSMDSQTQNTPVMQRKIEQGKFNLVGEHHQTIKNVKEKHYVIKELGTNAQLFYEDQFHVPDFPEKGDPEAKLAVDNRTLMVSYLYASALEKLKVIASKNYLPEEVKGAAMSLTGEPYTNLIVVQTLAKELLPEIDEGSSQKKALIDISNGAKKIYNAIADAENYDLEMISAVREAILDPDNSAPSESSNVISENRSKVMFAATQYPAAQKMTANGIVWKIGQDHIDHMHNFEPKDNVALTDRDEWVEGFEKYLATTNENPSQDLG